MDSLRKILGSREIAQAPDEIGTIKDYVSRRYKSKCRVKLQRGAWIVSVPNSALAATLQMERLALIKACNIKAKLVIRTGR